MQQGVDVFVFRFLFEGAVEQPAGFGIGVAEGAEDFEGLGQNVALDIGGRGHFTSNEQGKLRHLAAELGDDPVGGRGADAGERGEALGILLLNQIGHFLYRPNHGAEGLLHADAVDFANQLEELALDRA